jgi:hypothetical protein
MIEIFPVFRKIIPSNGDGNKVTVLSFSVNISQSQQLGGVYLYKVAKMTIFVNKLAREPPVLFVTTINIYVLM